MKGPEFLLIIIPIIALIAWIYAVFLFIDIAQKKGKTDVGGLWFIGLFASPIVLGLYVLALENQGELDAQPTKPRSVQDELPRI